MRGSGTALPPQPGGGREASTPATGPTRKSDRHQLAGSESPEPALQTTAGARQRQEQGGHRGGPRAAGIRVGDHASGRRTASCKTKEPEQARKVVRWRKGESSTDPKRQGPRSEHAYVDRAAPRIRALRPCPVRVYQVDKPSHLRTAFQTCYASEIRDADIVLPSKSLLLGQGNSTAETVFGGSFHIRVRPPSRTFIQSRIDAPWRAPGHGFCSENNDCTPAFRL